MRILKSYVFQKFPDFFVFDFFCNAFPEFFVDMVDVWVTEHHPNRPSEGLLLCDLVFLDEVEVFVEDDLTVGC
jgi:hypothetical protein